MREAIIVLVTAANSAEAERLFAPDREAAFFGSNEDLIDACRRWLADDTRRRAVADAGYERVRSGGHTHSDRLRMILHQLGLDLGPRAAMPRAAVGLAGGF